MTDTMARGAELGRIMKKFLREMTPQERDRRMQIHLAQARGPVANGLAIRSLMDTFIRVYRARRDEEGTPGARVGGGIA